MANEVFNEAFDEIVPDGSLGNQAYFGIFYQDRRGLFRRLTQAEGNEVAKNPETEERNTIGMRQAKTVVKSFKEQFSKDIIIEKSDDNYAFFNEFNEHNYTGRNAELRMIMIDFMQNIPASGGKQTYKAYTYSCTVTVDTANFTDAKLSVSFNQSSDRVSGIADYDEATRSAVFTPSSEITISGIILSETEVKLEVGEEKWVSVDFEPFGAPDSFIQKSSNEKVCTVEARRHSVVITGVGSGDATVEVKDAATESVTQLIEVMVA